MNSIQIKILSYAKDIALFVSVLFLVQTWQTRGHLRSGSPLEELELKTLAGEIKTVKFNNNPTVLYFYAPWCTVCKAVAHNIRSISNESSVQLISVALQYKSTQNIHAYLRENKIPLQNQYIGDSEIAKRFNISAFPTFYFVHNNTIESSTVGYTTELGIKLRSME